MKLTCCRVGVVKPNVQAKGKFVREFINLSQMALWIHKAGRNLYFPHIREELSPNQIKSLNMKLAALRKKQICVTK